MPTAMVLVNSSVVRAIGYHKSLAILRIELANGSAYDYHDVPQLTHEKIMRAPSKGEYLNREIKPKYKCTVVGTYTTAV